MKGSKCQCSHYKMTRMTSYRMSFSPISPQPHAHKTEPSTTKPTNTQRFVRIILLSLAFMLAIEEPGHVVFAFVWSAQMNLWSYFYFLVQGCGIRAPDAVWHHNSGRKKYHYFLDQPTSVTGAGRLISSTWHDYQLKQYIASLEYCPFFELLRCLNRDISFLCDALAAQRQRISLPLMPDRGTISLEGSQKASQAQEKILTITVPLVLRLIVWF